MRILSVALLGLVAAACTPNDVTLGGALKHNLAMQTVDPQPTYTGAVREGGSGDHAAKAMESYRQGTATKETTAPITVNIGGGGSPSN